MPVIPFIVALVVSLFSAQQAPLLGSTERARAKEMLGQIKSALRNDYYDKTFHGLDLNQHFKAAEAKIDTAVSQGHAYSIIAQALIDLNDSHTFFVPPDRVAKYEYGWKLSMIGDECFVVAVKPGSDAEAKGLKPGDRVLQYDAFPPLRDQLWKAQYLYHVLSPRRSLKLTVQGPDGGPRTLELAAKVTPGPKDKRVSLDNFFEGGTIDMSDGPAAPLSMAQRVGDVAIWKLSSFEFKPEDVDRIFDEVVKGASALVIDVRGNPGGLVKTLEQVVARLFDREVKIGDAKGRKATKTSIAKKHKDPFLGKLVVLVDSESASAAEVLARVVQLEERGKVIGDRSSGSVMESEFHAFALEVPDVSDVTLILYGVSVTAADLLMKDGKSLERVGVTPDEAVLPTAADLRGRRDPALARAAASLGAALTPEVAGKLFPVEWK
jgi:carboxyl-terminal processing protease